MGNLLARIHDKLVKGRYVLTINNSVQHTHTHTHTNHITSHHTHTHTYITSHHTSHHITHTYITSHHIASHTHTHTHTHHITYNAYRSVLHDGLPVRLTSKQDKVTLFIVRLHQDALFAVALGQRDLLILSVRKTIIF